MTTWYSEYKGYLWTAIIIGVIVIGLVIVFHQTEIAQTGDFSDGAVSSQTMAIVDSCIRQAQSVNGVHLETPNTSALTVCLKHNGVLWDKNS